MRETCCYQPAPVPFAVASSLLVERKFVDISGSLKVWMIKFLLLTVSNSKIQLALHFQIYEVLFYVRRSVVARSWCFCLFQ